MNNEVKKRRRKKCELHAVSCQLLMNNKLNHSNCVTFLFPAKFMRQKQKPSNSDDDICPLSNSRVSSFSVVNNQVSRPVFSHPYFFLRCNICRRQSKFPAVWIYSVLINPLPSVLLTNKLLLNRPHRSTISFHHAPLRCYQFSIKIGFSTQTVFLPKTFVHTSILPFHALA